MTDPIPALRSRTADELDRYRQWLFAEARTVLAAHPASPAEGEVAELVEWLENHADDWKEMGLQNWADKYIRIRDLLAQRYPAPVPVSERPWERDGWCDAEGRCWWGWTFDEFCSCDWRYYTRAEIEEFCFPDAMPQASLPAHALPLPAGEVV